jgi:hypothetical protein
MLLGFIFIKDHRRENRIYIHINPRVTGVVSSFFPTRLNNTGILNIVLNMIQKGSILCRFWCETSGVRFPRLMNWYRCVCVCVCVCVRERGIYYIQENRSQCVSVYECRCVYTILSDTCPLFRTTVPTMSLPRANVDGHSVTGLTGSRQPIRASVLSVRLYQTGTTQTV